MSIRTTVTLDEDVIERAKDFSKARGLPFRQALNDLVRAGLLAESSTRVKSRFRVEPKRMGVRPGINYDHTAGLLEIGEGDRHR
jgi:hypothetical protein